MARSEIIPDGLPARMSRLARDSAGRPVPWFVPWVDGKPDFRLMEPQRLVDAIRDELCFLCGQRLLRVHGHAAPRGVFVAGPMCLVNGTSAEPPNHNDCAEWAAKACPFLTKPAKERRTGGLPEVDEAAGIAILRNPGVTALISSERWRVYQAHAGHGGILFNIQRITNVGWMCEGRRAHPHEVYESIETGLPALIELAEEEPGGMAVLAQRLRTALRWVPTPTFGEYVLIRKVLEQI